jgi:hypothetical protein
VRAQHQRGVVGQDAAVAADRDDVGGGRLPVATLAPGLDDRLRQRGEAPHVVGGELAAAGVHRQRPAGPERAGGGQRPAFALRAEPVVLQRHQHRVGVAVVDLAHADVTGTDAGHGHGGRARDGCAGGQPELAAPFHRLAGMALPPAPDVHRRLGQPGGPLGAGHHHRHASVGDQAAVQQVQRLDDPARSLMVVQRDRLAELGQRVTRRPRPLRHRDRPELLAGRSVGGHVPPRRQRVLGRDRPEPVPGPQPAQPVPFRPLCSIWPLWPRPFARDSCTTPARSAEGRSRGSVRPQRCVREHARHRARRPARDRQRGQADRCSRGSAVGIDHAEQPQVAQPEYLGQADVQGPTGDSRADQQPVHVGQAEAGVRHRGPHRLGGQPPRAAAVDLAELGEAEAGDRCFRHDPHRTESRSATGRVDASHAYPGLLS